MSEGDASPRRLRSCRPLPVCYGQLNVPVSVPDAAL